MVNLLTSRTTRMVEYAPSAILLFIVSGCQKLPLAEENSKPIKNLYLNQTKRFAKVMHPKKADLIETIPFLGIVEPSRTFSAHFFVEGRVASCRIRPGMAINPGDELCRLDTSAVELELQRAKNAVEGAKKLLSTNLLDKQKVLFEAGVIGQSEFERIRIQTESAKSQLQDAQSLLYMSQKKKKEHFLYSNIQGKVTKVLVKTGQPVSPLVPVAILSDDSSLHVTAEFHSSLFQTINLGINGEITAISYEDLESPILISVIEKSTSVSPESQSFKVSMTIKQKEPIPLGIMVSGNLFTKVLNQVYQIPQSALISWNTSGDSEVYVLKSNRLVKKSIKTGALSLENIEVLSGLSHEDRVVTEQANDFRPGLEVWPLE